MTRSFCSTTHNRHQARKALFASPSMWRNCLYLGNGRSNAGRPFPERPDSKSKRLFA
jgi:hypothetical protein